LEPLLEAEVANHIARDRVIGADWYWRKESRKHDQERHRCRSHPNDHAGHLINRRFPTSSLEGKAAFSTVSLDS
jgi:hypothetical protein